MWFLELRPGGERLTVCTCAFIYTCLYLHGCLALCTVSLNGFNIHNQMLIPQSIQKKLETCVCGRMCAPHLQPSSESTDQSDEFPKLFFPCKHTQYKQISQKLFTYWSKTNSWNQLDCKTKWKSACKTYKNGNSSI